MCACLCVCAVFVFGVLNGRQWLKDDIYVQFASKGLSTCSKNVKPFQE